MFAFCIALCINGKRFYKRLAADGRHTLNWCSKFQSFKAWVKGVFEAYE